MKAKKHAHDKLAAHASEQAVPPVADRPRVHWAALGSLFTGLLGMLLTLAKALGVYWQEWGSAPFGAFAHLFFEVGDFFGLGSMLVSLVAIVLGIQALYAAHQEPRWKRGKSFALAGLVLGGLPVLLSVLLFSLLLPYYLIALGGALGLMLVVLLLKLARRVFHFLRS